MNKKSSSALVVILITLFIIIISASSSNASTDIDRITEIVNHRMKVEKQIVGTAVAVIEGDKVEYLTFGLRQKAKALKVTPETLFEIGSITKTFTTSALAALVSEGKISLDDNVEKYLAKEVALPNDKLADITFLSLANHTSGLPRLPTNMPFSNPLDPYADYNEKLLFDFLSHYELPRAVGSQPEYSNLGVGLLGNLLTKVHGNNLQALLSEKILTPLNMASTFVETPTAKASLLSDGHNEGLIVTPPWTMASLGGAGALKSNIKDMSLYLQANMNKSVLEKAFNLAQQPTTNFSQPGTQIGLGWIIIGEGETQYLMHNGGTGGFRSFIGFNPSKQRGIVILNNSAIPQDDIGHAYLTHQLANIKLVEPTIVANKDLDRLLGQYQLAPNFILEVTKDNGQLYIQATGQPKLAFNPESETTFVNKAVQARIVFELDEANGTSALILHQGGQVLNALKI